MRAATFLLLALALAAGCGGEAATETVTVTVTETVEATGEDDRAWQLAHDLCDSIPSAFLAPFLGADARSPERLGERFAELARPDLREPAAAGCAAGASN